MKNETRGRRAIFPGKMAAGADRVQGVLSPIGSKAFEQARARLAKLTAREPEQVSDADTIEYLARGETATRRFLEGTL